MSPSALCRSFIAEFTLHCKVTHPASLVNRWDLVNRAGSKCRAARADEGSVQLQQFRNCYRPKARTQVAFSSPGSPATGLGRWGGRKSHLSLRSKSLRAFRNCTRESAIQCSIYATGRVTSHRAHFFLRAEGEPFCPKARITRWRTKLADDREVWKRISQGDAKAFDAFYRENAPRLHAFLRQVVGNPQAAEDVAQDTFTQIWNRPNGFEPERGTLRAYVFGIGRKRAAEWWRKQGTRKETVQDEPAECRTETASLVADALARLPQEGRSLIWLREVE